MAKPQRKRKTGKKSRRRDTATKKGSMASMRSGFKNVVGTGQKKKPSPGANFISYLLLIIALGLLVWTLVR